MKKFVFALPALLILGWSSCTSDSCSFEGKWIVKTADLQSATLDSTILAMAEQEYLDMQYEFTKDSVKIISGNQTITAAWQLEDASQEISWNAVMQNGQEMKESHLVESCTSNEIILSQRMPNDTTQKELARVLLTLQKGEGKK